MSLSIGAQERYQLQIRFEDSTNVRYSYKKRFENPTDRQKEVDDAVLYFHQKAFLEARCDSLSGDSLLRIAHFYRGPKYFLTRVELSASAQAACVLADFRPGQFKKMPLTAANLQRYQREVLAWFENHGYPFTRVWFDDMQIVPQSTKARLYIDPVNRVEIDSLVRKGNVRISRNYIYRYLGIKPGHIYDESKIRKITKRLEDLPFASVTKPFEVAFWPDKARIYLYLNKKKASHFSGVLGVLPNSQVPGKVLISGDVKLHLLNSFGQGELIDLNWRSLEKGTQDLRVKLNYPYLLTTPLGLDYEFYLYKKDTSYLTLNHKIGIQFQFTSYSYLQLFSNLFSSDIIQASGLESLTVLPDFADIRRNMFGLGLNHEVLDYRMNPRKGFTLFVAGSGGVKQIERNDKINPALYDSLDLKSGQFQADLYTSYFIPLFRRQTVLLNLNAAYIWNDVLFDNELIRLGGLKSLRGFDEESIKASFFTSILIEYRFLFERNSFLAVFWNGAFVEKNTFQAYHSDLPYGLGAGISFDTKIGMFSLYYAIGSQNGGPLLFSQSKIHFGINTRF